MWKPEQMMARRPLTRSTRVQRHENLTGEYWLLRMEAPEIAPLVQPGQFLHLDIPTVDDALLRRPFSIYRAEEDCVSILYKPVGKGTRAMLRLREGDTVSLIAPLGHGFPMEREVRKPLLVAGGYGMAALYMVAERLPTRGVIFMGGASARDILCVADFESLGWEVRIATVDGSSGTRGLVTDVLDAHLEELQTENPDWRGGLEFFACGPNPMLRAVADRATQHDLIAWLSMDRHMGCGVGACLVCVQKVRAPETQGGWAWARACTEGPVFESREILWEEASA